MKKNSFLLVLLLLSNVLFAQKNLTIDTNKIKVVETKRDEENLNLLIDKEVEKPKLLKPGFICLTAKEPELIILKRDKEIIDLITERGNPKMEFVKSELEFFQIDQLPEFPGGEDKLLKFIKINQVYPKLAIDNNIEGKVDVGFTINENGEVSDIKILRGIGYGCDEEAMRVISIMPKWKPAKHDEKPVSFKFSIPVQFKLKD